MELQRVRELLISRTLRNRILFTGARRRSAAVAVRGDQMAEEVGGFCLRTKYLTNAAVRSSPALIWIAEQKPELFERYRTMTPQILDVINPNATHVQLPPELRYPPFRYLMVNTESTLSYLGPEPERGWLWWVVPHHHCNQSGYALSQERVERPRTVGYVGEPEHLHDTEAIASLVSKLGLRWVSADSEHLEAYRDIDIGVAWTRRETIRDATRSNIKLANFVGHGIPSVVCDYESYRDVDRALGGGATMICSSLQELLEAIAEVACNRDLRTEMVNKARPGAEMYSRPQIGARYLQVIAEARKDFESGAGVPARES